MSRETPATEKQLRFAFKVSARLWNVCKEIFEELADYLSVKESFMGLVVELDLQKGMKETEYKNPKMHEMRQHLYNSENYKPKGTGTELELPKTLTVVVENHKMSDEALDEINKDNV